MWENAELAKTTTELHNLREQNYMLIDSCKLCRNINKCYLMLVLQRQTLKKVPSCRPGQVHVDSPPVQVTFYSNLPGGQRIRQTVCQLKS